MDWKISYNLMGPVSKRSNCEEDDFFALLNNINTIMLDFDKSIDKPGETDQANVMQIDSEKEYEQRMLDMIVFDPLFGEPNLNFVETESIANTTSVICRKLIEISPCSECQVTLEEPTSPESIAKDIIFPSQNFTKHFERLFLAINVTIPHFCHEKSVRKKIVSQVESPQDYSIGCEIHCKELADTLKDMATNHALTIFCNTINNTLSGKVTELPSGCNHIQAKAFEFRQKKLHIGKHSDKFLG